MKVASIFLPHSQGILSFILNVCWWYFFTLLNHCEVAKGTVCVRSPLPITHLSIAVQFPRQLALYDLKRPNGRNEFMIFSPLQELQEAKVAPKCQRDGCTMKDRTIMHSPRQTHK